MGKHVRLTRLLERFWRLLAFAVPAAAGKAGQYIECGGEITFPARSVAVASARSRVSSDGGTAAARVLAFAGLALNSHCSVWRRKADKAVSMFGSEAVMEKEVSNASQQPPPWLRQHLFRAFESSPVKCLRCYIMLALFLITFEGQTSTIYWLLLQYASEHCSPASAALTDEKIRSRSCEGNILFYRI